MFTFEFQNSEIVSSSNFKVNQKLQKGKKKPGLIFQNGTSHLAVVLISLLAETISV